MARNKILKNKEQIIDAALKLIQDEGLEAVSMRRLSKEMGVSSMTLYNYVQNAEDILREILVRSFSVLYENIYTQMSKYINSGMSVIAAYAKAYAVSLYDFSESNREICKYMIGDGYRAFHNNAELRPLYEPFGQFVLGSNGTEDSINRKKALQLYENIIHSLITKRTMGIEKGGKEEYLDLVDLAIKELIL